MSRPLCSVALALALLAGCTTLPPAPVSTAEQDVEVPGKLTDWLAQYATVQDFTPEQALEKLVRVKTPNDVDALFYYGLLNQQLDSYGARIQARDAFDKLEKDEGLAAEQRILAGILRNYNQSRINSQTEVEELQGEMSSLRQQLDTTHEEKLLLEQKIQALTDLESDISTRKEE